MSARTDDNPPLTDGTVNLPDHGLAPRHPPVPRGPAQVEPDLRTITVRNLFATVCGVRNPTVAFIPGSDRKHLPVYLRRSECPPFDGAEATFQVRYRQGRIEFVREVG